MIKNEENLNNLEDNVVIAIIQKDGEVSWVVSENMTKEQQDSFKKVFAVTQSPSIILKLVILIELMLLTIVFTFENMLGKKDGKK
jgi:uncharacterized BrkB/YihY/UPF0761 family membrane protein